jgi:integrase/recombinase XerD
MDQMEGAEDTVTMAALKSARNTCQARAELKHIEAEEMLFEAVRSIASERTRGEYARDVRQYLEHVQRSGEAIAEGLESWKGELRAGGASVSTVNRKLSGVKTVMRKAADAQGPEFRRALEASLSSVKGIRQARGAVRAEKMLTPEEVAALEERLSDRGRRFVHFLYATGCRVSEMVRIRLKDCHVNGGVTIEVMGKGGKARKVRISAAFFHELRDAFQGTTWLFETANGTPYRREYISNMIERASVRALGRMVGAHALRHSFATALIAKTGKVQAVSEYLGHADPAMTLRFYVHETLTDDELGTLKE